MNLGQASGKHVYTLLKMVPIQGLAKDASADFENCYKNWTDLPALQHERLFDTVTRPWSTRSLLRVTAAFTTALGLGSVALSGRALYSTTGLEGRGGTVRPYTRGAIPVDYLAIFGLVFMI